MFCACLFLYLFVVYFLNKQQAKVSLVTFFPLPLTGLSLR